MNPLLLVLSISLILLFLSGPSYADDTLSKLSIEERYRTAQAFQLEGKFGSALPYLISIRDEFKNHLDAPGTSQEMEFEIGNCLLSLGRWREARDAFRRCFLLTAKEEHKREVLTAIGEFPSKP